MEKKCPRCGTLQEGLTECELCGLVFDEFEGPNAPGTRRSSKLKYILVLGILLVASAAVFWPRGEPHALKGNIVTKIQWVTDYREGLSLARETGRPALVFFTASWCASCKSLMSNAFSDVKVIRSTAKVIPIYVDVDQNRQLVADFSIHGIPTVFFLDSQGKAQMKFVGPYDAQAYIDAIEKMAAGS